MEITGRVAEAFGLGRVLDCRPMTDGVMNLSWRLTTPAGTFAVKQLRDRTPGELRPLLEILPRLAAMGFPVPLPYQAPMWIDGDWYAVASWLDGAYPADLAPARCAELGELVGRLHLALAELCPPAPPHLPGVCDPINKIKTDLHGYASRPPADDFDRHVQQEIRWRLDVLANADPPTDADLAPCGWTHGDLQPYNLLVDADGRITGILDWDRLGVRPYGLEVVRTATITFGRSTGRMAAFVRGYRTHIPISGAQLADAAHRRWWTLLTEAWPLDRHYGDNDHTCDHLFVRRCEYLRWWTAHRAEVSAALS
ncbi:phosphotransferase [Actinoplanes sp. CA-142083]|uniref:phosphotransferase n=1 Tax=Actinoplanes sp. CA-142083 TaxID=3239903 RepID=UPI003D901F2D